MRSLLAAGIILTTTPVLAALPTTQELRALPAQTQIAARTSLQTLRQLVDTENVRDLGFETPQQAQQAQLGQPLLDYTVRLDELAKYDGGDPAKYLHATGQAVYPVLVDGKPRSSITLLRKGSTWTRCHSARHHWPTLVTACFRRSRGPRPVARTAASRCGFPP